MISISLGLHLFILAIFLNIFPRAGTVKKIEPSYVVDLVSLPDSGPIGNNQKSEQPFVIPSSPPPRIEPKPVVIPKPIPEKPSQVKDRTKTLDQVMEQLRKKVQLVTPSPPSPLEEPKPVPKKSHQVEDQSKALDQAMKQLRGKVQQEKTLGKTLSQLEDKVKNEQTLEKALAQLEKKKQSGYPAGQGTGTGGSGDVTSSVPGMPDGSGIHLQLYHASLLSRIKKNWVLPEGLIKRKDISAVVMILISRNGHIENYHFERKSGIEAFDEEVLRTLKKSDPLPALPEGFPKNIYEIFLTFHSKDLSERVE